MASRLWLSSPCEKQVEILWAQWVDSQQLCAIDSKGFEDRQIRSRSESVLD